MIINTFWSDYDIEVRRVLKKKYQPKKYRGKILNRNYDKVFCIGNHKTGTSSIGRLLGGFGLITGNQGVAEVLAVDSDLQRRIERICQYVHSADAFQDSPFMHPEIYKELDKVFPHSKFILTVRDTPDQWFQSLVKFHTKRFSRDKNRCPDELDLKTASYRYKGWMLEAMKTDWKFPEIPLYEETYYKQRYINLIEQANTYFKGREDAFIQINVSQPEDFSRLCRFLNLETQATEFPWENKT